METVKPADKGLFRKKALSLRNNILKEQKNIFDEQIFNRITDFSVFKNASMIFGYCSTGAEADTWQIISYCLNTGKRIAVPKTYSENQMIFYEILDRETELKKGYMDIYEPCGKALERKIEKADLVLVPGCAFDYSFKRMGYGKGFYDRYFASHEYMVKVGITYKQQVFDSIPSDIHDIAMDYIITEKEIWTREKNR